MELELSFFGVTQPVIVFPCGFEQRVSADDIGLDELARTVDRTVHMAFRGEVHHMRRLELGEHTIQFGPVADVDLLELEPVGFRDRSEIFKVPGVGEFVDYADGIRCVVDDVPGHGRPDESGSAGNNDTVHKIILFKNDN